MAVYVNFPLMVVTIFLFATCVMMIYAITKPSWSSSEIMEAGLWTICTWNGDWFLYSYYTCTSLTASIPFSGYLVACQALAVAGTVLAGMAACLACFGTWIVNSFMGKTLACLCLLCSILFTVAWGMWIGVHNQNFKSPGWGLDYCFALCVVASVLMFFGVCLSLWGARSYKHQKKFAEQQMAAEIDFPDGVSPDADEMAHNSTPVPSAANEIPKVNGPDADV